MNIDFMNKKRKVMHCVNCIFSVVLVKLIELYMGALDMVFYIYCKLVLVLALAQLSL